MLKTPLGTIALTLLAVAFLPWSAKPRWGLELLVVPLVFIVGLDATDIRQFCSNPFQPVSGQNGDAACSVKPHQFGSKPVTRTGYDLELPAGSDDGGNCDHAAYLVPDDP